MRGPYWYLPAVLLAAAAVSCARPSDNPGQPETGPPPTPTPAVDGAAQVRSALGMEDRLARREATLVAMGVYLADEEVAAMGDEEVSQALTELAFSTGRVVLPDPTLVRRAPGEPGLAVVGLPDGMGLALYDLHQNNAQPVLLTPWTAGLEQAYVTWAEAQDEVGVSYVTVGVDGLTRAHFVLAVRDTDAESGWDVAWYSDEIRDWWLNGYNAQLEVAPDLSQLTLVGTSEGTTLTFDEVAGGVQRTFETTWQRVAAGYEIVPDPADYDTHQAWLWEIARPGPYATLVEFLERLREEDEGGASRLATSSVHALTAVELGLALPPRRYTLLEQAEDSIMFGDQAGVYRAEFIPPPRDGEKWLIVDITPLTVP